MLYYTDEFTADESLQPVLNYSTLNAMRHAIQI